MKTLQRIKWIDSIRGLCMLSILLYHTEIYYTSNAIIPYHIYVVNALTTFFFISGFLFWKNKQNYNLFQLKYKIRSIIRTLIVPYFVFTTIMAIPKTIAHGENFDISNSIQQIIIGQASWFITSLVVAEFLFLLILYFSKNKVNIIFICSSILFCFSLLFNYTKFTIPWNIHVAAFSMPFITLGYLCNQFRYLLYKYINVYTFILSLLILLLCKYIEWQYHLSMLVFALKIDNIIVFLIDTITAIYVLIYVVKHLPYSHFIQWVGKHSIIYYFLCGGVPLLTSKLFNTINLVYTNNYFLVLLVFCCVILITTLLTWFIRNYIKLF